MTHPWHRGWEQEGGIKILLPTQLVCGKRKRTGGQLFAGIKRKRLKGLGSFLLAVHWLYHLIDLFIGIWASRCPCPLDVIDTAEDATVNLTGNPKYFPNSLAIHVLIYKKKGLDMQISKI